MWTLEETWGREKVAATVYDFAVQNPVVGRVAALAMWGFDIRKLFTSIEYVADAQRGSRVLDVPCGGGLVFSGLTRDHGLDYTALDYSPVMLERAHRKQEKLGLPGISFQQGDVGALPYNNATFDLALTYNGIHCFPDPQQAIRELARVLKPGGTLRGTLVVRGAGLRYDALFRLFILRGFFGPGCTRDELAGWLDDNGLRLRQSEQSGAIMLFEAVKK